MKRVSLAAILRAMLAAALAATPALAQEQLVDGIAAQVGSEIVLLSEVIAASAPVEAQALAAGAAPRDLAEIRSQALEAAIERALIRQVVHRAELDASDAEVDDAIAGIAQENDITPSDIRSQVESQGMPFKVYRERIRGEIEHSKVMNGIIASRVRVSEVDVRTRYDEELGNQPEGGNQYFLRHLLVTAQPEGRTIAEACQTAQAARRRVQAGEEFARVAAEVSEANPERGGTLGWIHERELAEWMKVPLESLGDAGVSPVIQKSFGCNLIELVERRSYEHITYEQAQNRIYNLIFSERMQVAYTKFVEELRSDTYIERKDVFAGLAPPAPAGDGSS